MKKWFLWLFFALPAYSGPLEDAGLQDVSQALGNAVFIRLRYATDNNFTGKKIYDFNKCYLHKDTIAGLKTALALAAQADTPFTFCLWDCYRPQDAHLKLWQAFPNASYVASPKRGSRHSRGMAVDLTPCDFNGTPLEMPTDFDTFTPRAHMDNFEAPAKLLRRRALLKKIMEQAGFSHTRTEWWHFDKKGWKQKPLLNIPVTTGEEIK